MCKQTACNLEKEPASLCTKIPNLKVLVVHTTKILGNQTCTAGTALMTFTIVAIYYTVYKCVPLWLYMLYTMLTSFIFSTA